MIIRRKDSAARKACGRLFRKAQPTYPKSRGEHHEPTCGERAYTPPPTI
jgi:hypothetical protein